MNKAIVIYGPQGSGKSTLAEEMAIKNGSTLMIGFNLLFRPFGFNRIIEMGKKLSNGFPDTLIIQDAQIKDLDTLKMFVSNEKIFVNRKGKEPIFIDTPKNVIIELQVDKLPEEILNDRRFSFLKVDDLNSSRSIN